MRQATALDHARALLARGLVPTPVKYRLKEPILPGWQKLRLSSESQLATHFGGKTLNVGVLTGEPSDWIVDVDIDDMRALDLADGILPATGMTWGRESKPRSHRLYRVTHPVENERWKHSSGMIVELRSTGLQTVAPGSVHESGEVVRWDDEGEPALIDPGALLASLVALSSAVLAEREDTQAELPTIPVRAPVCPPSGDTSNYGAAALQREADSVARTPEGARNDTLNKAAFNIGTLVGGGEVDQRDAERALADAAAACGLGNREAASTIASGMNAGIAYPRSRPSSPSALPVSVSAAQLKFEPVNARDMIRQYPDLRPVVIDGLLREGETMNVVAAPKVGKSWLVHWLALSVCAGTPWLGKSTTPGRVLLIDGELHKETLTRRLERTREHLDLPESTLANLDVLALRGQRVTIDEIAHLSESIGSGTYRLIILDALYRFLPMGGEENANETMTQIYNQIDHLARCTRASVVIVHHASKGNQSEKSVTDVGSGAGAQSRAADTHLILRQHEEEHAVVVDAVVRSFAPLEPFVIQSTRPGWELAAHLDPANLRRGGRRRRAESEKMPEESKRVWTPELFAQEIVGPEKLIRADVIARAVKKGLAKTQAEDLLDRARECKAVYVHARQNEKQRFSTLPADAEP